MIISNKIFLIRRFFRNLGHLDLKLVESRWRTRCLLIWSKCIGWIGFWTVSHLWYCDIFAVFILGWHATEDSQTSVHAFAGRAVKRLLESQHVLGINSQHIQRTPKKSLISTWRFILNGGHKSLKLPPSSSSSAKGHTGKHEEHARNHEDLLALWVAFNVCLWSPFSNVDMILLAHGQHPCLGAELLWATLLPSQHAEEKVSSINDVEASC